MHVKFKLNKWRNVVVIDFSICKRLSKGFIFTLFKIINYELIKKNGLAFVKKKKKSKLDRNKNLFQEKIKIMRFIRGRIHFFRQYIEK